MITRTEAKSIADAVISPERRANLEGILDGIIRTAANEGKYSVKANEIMKEVSDNEAEQNFIYDLLTQNGFSHRWEGPDFYVSWE